MVDFASIGAGNSLGFESLPDAPRVIGEFFDALQRKLLAVVADQEKPVAAPCDIAVDAADAGHVHRDGGGASETGDIADGHAAVVIQARFHGSAVGIDAANALLNSAHVSERNHEPNGSVAAHVEEADVVEENDAGLTSGVVRIAEQRAHNGVVATRFVDYGGADVVEMGAKPFEALLN